MLLEAEIKKHGNFWLPENPDNKIAGELTIFTNGQIQINFVNKDFFHNVDYFKRVEIRTFTLYGNIENVGKITAKFYENNCSNKQNSFEINANYILIGNLIEDNNLLCNKLKFSLYNFKTIFSQFKYKKELIIPINDDKIQEIIITQEKDKLVSFEIIAKEYQDIDYLISTADKIITLLNFIFDTNFYITKMSIYMENITTYTDIYYSKYKAIYDEDAHCNILSDLNYDIYYNFELIIKKWLENYQDYRYLLDLYFYAISKTPMPPRIKFLSLIQIFEAWHVKIDKSEKCLRKRILEALKELKYITIISLNSKKTGNLAMSIKNSRDKYTHEASPFSINEDLMLYINILELILNVYILEILGFNNDKIKSILDSHKSYLYPK